MTKRRGRQSDQSSDGLQIPKPLDSVVEGVQLFRWWRPSDLQRLDICRKGITIRLSASGSRGEAGRLLNSFFLGNLPNYLVGILKSVSMDVFEVGYKMSLYFSGLCACVVQRLWWRYRPFREYCSRSSERLTLLDALIYVMVW
jgi:hypothetical protein